MAYIFQASPFPKPFLSTEYQLIETLGDYFIKSLRRDLKWGYISNELFACVGVVPERRTVTSV